MVSLAQTIGRRVQNRLLGGLSRKKNYRKRKNRMMKRRYQNRFKPSVLSVTTGFPEKLLTKLKYVETVSLGNGITTIGSYTYRCNSVYDPNFTGGGHQPLYFDQLATVYANYKVVKAKIQATYLSVQGVSLGNLIAGIDILDSDNTVDTDPNTLRERPGSRYTAITPQVPSRLTSGWNIKKSMVSGEDSYTALCTASPVNTDYFRVYVVSGDGITPIPANCGNVHIEITYYTEFFNPIMVNGS